PYEAWKVPLIKLIYESVPYPVYLLLYVIAMSAAAGLVLGLTHAVARIDGHSSERREKSA
ncbi:MAG: hypothetical protein K2N30_01075, partial [Clostridia bacterium]|nr:hypothetical protein [Clostridia bacterium]